MIANRPAIANGRFALPESPGFGWELDNDFIAAHRISYPRGG